ncbi:hypothetical protein J2792_000731 [Novosphingobium capsulatum]|uniref:Uncharacterized protein n=1 Tax=Novosphingobium capsulatum TaxID=13688 RepID=A0ABU1MHV9_9SPHN|nr:MULTISPECIES: hypothetical protein [Novosphingobium]MBB3357612.1 hypothetical protein [Novosphingobium sp. BK256]MBB3373724.1 hypothetical protein [Novosphingobium sp. BK280]MBB3378136.1 hypothetical protein [Novosphingobium sp. BK258]MBB3420079.1 hypothetical protein [Novosphingobium sp. BK267]MBB3447599.1 hypothetical protein [Novosphingobium sp. BK352]
MAAIIATDMADPVPNHRAAAPHDAQALPRTEAEAQARAGQDGWQIPAPCLPGVMANLALLARHAAIFAGDDHA